MSPPMSQECWDHNRRLYQEMTASSTPRPPQIETPLASTQQTQRPRELDNTRSSAHSLPRPTHPMPSVRHTTPGASDGRLAHPASRMGRTPAQRLQPNLSPTLPSSALAPASMPNLNVPDPTPQISYYIRTSHRSAIHHKPLPTYISRTLSPPLPKPSPSLRQILTLAQPTTSLVKFSCGCLNHGTCIHYQIIFRRDHLPDGLICPACRDPKTRQQIVTAKRKCPGHVDDSGTEKKHVSSRPEDFLASEEQKRGYEEVMGRVMSGRWDTSTGGMGERESESVLARGGMEGSAMMAHQTRASGGMAAMAREMTPASRRVAPGSQHQHGAAAAPTMHRPTIEPQPDSRQLSIEPTMLPPSAWPINSPAAPPISASIPAHSASQTFFTQIPAPSVPSAHSPPSPHTLSQLHTEALADDAALSLRAENRRMGIPNADDDDEMLILNLRDFETGGWYEPGATLGRFFDGSGMDLL